MASVVGKIRRRQRRRVFAPGRQLLDRSNPIENLSDEETFRKYRFRKNTIFFICELMNDFLQRPTHRSGALPVLYQVLATLRFLATVVGDTISLSTASISRCVSSFCKGAVQLSKQFMRMPLPEEAATHKMRFYKIAGFPNVIGCVDGTQIRIERPNENENDFINRKGYPSINVQVRTMNRHQVLTGACNTGDKCYAVGNVEGIHFTAYAAGCDIVILASDFQRVQIIPGVTHGNIKVSCIDCSTDSGKIAASYLRKVYIFEPAPLLHQESTHKLDYHWYQTAVFEAECVVNCLSWNIEGLKLLTGGEVIQIWSVGQEIHDDDHVNNKVKFSLGGHDQHPDSAIHLADAPTTDGADSFAVWECIWRIKPSLPVYHLDFSPDGLLFASAGKADRLVKIWYEDRKIQLPLSRADSMVSPKKEDLHYSFVYIAHPRAVTGFSWRKTSKYMPRGSVANMLVTSCKDKVCRIWCETILPDDGLVDLEQFDPNASFDPKFHTHRHKKRFMQRLKTIRHAIHKRRKHHKFGPETVLSMPNLSNVTSVHDFHKFAIHHNGVAPALHFHLAASVNPETDIPLLPVVNAKQEVEHNFQLYWLNNKELQFTMDSEKILHEIHKSSIYDDSSSHHHGDHLHADHFTDSQTDSDHPHDDDDDDGGHHSKKKGHRIFKSKNEKNRNSMMLGSHEGSQSSIQSDNSDQFSSGGTSPNISPEVAGSIIDALDRKIEGLLRDWHQHPDVLFSVHPVDGSFLVWLVDWLDEYTPYSFRQAQISFSSRLPHAFPIPDARSMENNLLMYCNYSKMDVKSAMKMSESKFSVDNIQGHQTAAATGKSSPGQNDNMLIPNVLLISKHSNGSLNQWQISFLESSMFRTVVSVAHASRACGHRFRTNTATCHPALPLLITTSHHNIPEPDTPDNHNHGDDADDSPYVNDILSDHNAQPASQPRRNTGTQGLPASGIQFCSELILWRVDPVGPLSKSGGIVELARINAPDHSAFSNVAWVPTLLPSTSLGMYSNSPSALFVASDGVCLRLYQTVIDARSLLMEMSSRKEPMSFSSNTSSGYSADFHQPAGELFDIVSVQSSSRPGCIIELESFTDAEQDWQQTQLLHVFQEQLVTGKNTSRGDNCSAMEPVVDLRNLGTFEEHFFLVVLEKAKENGSVLHMWKITISSQSGAQAEAQTEKAYCMDYTLVDEDSNPPSRSGSPELPGNRPVPTAKLSYSTAKVLTQKLDLPEGVEVTCASVAAGHLSSSSIYPACLAPYLLVTACTDGDIRFWECNVSSIDQLCGTHMQDQTMSLSTRSFEFGIEEEDGVRRPTRVSITHCVLKDTSYQWREWKPTYHQGSTSTIHVPGKPITVSCAYTGRIAIAYRFGGIKTISNNPENRFFNLCVAIYECESTGGSEWVREDTIELRNIKIPDTKAEVNLDVICSPDGTGKVQTLNDSEGSQSLSPSSSLVNMSRTKSVPSLSTIYSARKCMEDHADKIGLLQQKHLVQLDWVSTEDGSHVLTVGVGSKIMMYAQVSNEIVQASQKSETELEASKKTLMNDPGHKMSLSEPARRRSRLQRSKSMVVDNYQEKLQWMKLRSIELTTADGLPPLPMHMSWVRAGILVVGMDNEMHVYSQWRYQGSRDSGHFNDPEDNDIRSIEDMNLMSLDLRKQPMLQPGKSKASFKPSYSMPNFKKVASQKKASPKASPNLSRSTLKRSESSVSLTVIHEFGLFEAARQSSPVLPQYHPKSLMELLNFGKVRRVKAILAHLVRCVAGGESTYANYVDDMDMDDGRHFHRQRTISMAQSPGEAPTLLEEVALDYAEISSIPPLPLYALLAADNEFSQAEIIPHAGPVSPGDKTDYRDLFSTSVVEDDILDTNVLSSSADNKPKSRLVSVSVSGMALNPNHFGPQQAQHLTKHLTHTQLPGLSSLDQMYLMALADTVAKTKTDFGDSAGDAAAAGPTTDQNNQPAESLDNCGLRYLLAMRHHIYLTRSLPIGQRAALKNQGLKSFNLVWAFHSESTEELLSLIPGMQKGEPTWEELKLFGAGWWINNINILKRTMEKVAKTAFQFKKDPMDSSLFYLAMKKKNVLWGLFRSVEDKKMSDFFRNDFSQDRWRKAALKNAFALLGRQRFEHAAGFFLLAGHLSDAIEVCLDKLNDIQLALVICRLYDGEDMMCEPVRKIFYSHILGCDEDGNISSSIRPHHDPFLRSMAYWLLKDYREALQTLVQKDVGDSKRFDDSEITATANVFNFYNYLRTHPLLIRHRIAAAASAPILKNRSVIPGFTKQQTIVGTPEDDVASYVDRVTSMERRLFFTTAHAHYKNGCPILALEVLSKLPVVIDEDEDFECDSNISKPDSDNCIASGTISGFEKSSVQNGNISENADEVDWSKPFRTIQDTPSGLDCQQVSKADDFDWGQPVSRFDDDDGGFKIMLSSDSESESDQDVTVKDVVTEKMREKIPSIVIEDSENHEVNDPTSGYKSRKIKSHQIDIFAQQYKFIACLKVMMEEMQTLATGFEVDGGQLRFQVYIWLEREVEALKWLCHYGEEEENEEDKTVMSDGAVILPRFVPQLALHTSISEECAFEGGEDELRSDSPRTLQRHLSSRSDSSLGKPTLHEVILSEKMDFEAKLERMGRRKQWLRQNQQLLRTLVAYCVLQGAGGGGLASVRMELLLLLQELQQEKPQQQLLSPLPFPTTLPLLSASIASSKTVTADPIQHIQCLCQDLLHTVIEFSSPPGLGGPLNTVLVMRNLSIALSSCIYQCLCDSDSFVVSLSDNMDVGLEGFYSHNFVCQSSHLMAGVRKHLRKSTSASEDVVNISPAKWPGVTSLRVLLAREKDEDSPKLNILLCESLIAVYVSLLINAMATYDCHLLFRIIAHRFDQQLWSALFGGGVKTVLHLQQGGPQNSKSMDETHKQRMRLNMKIMGAGARKESKKTYKERFVPPELSMITFLMTKPFIVNNDSAFHYDSEESLSSEEEDEDDDEDYLTSRPTTLPISSAQQHTDPSSYAWCLIRLAIVKLVLHNLRNFLPHIGIELAELPVCSPLMHATLRTVEQWEEVLLGKLELFSGPPDDFITGIDIEIIPGVPSSKYKALLDKTNSPFINGHTTLPIKRLWFHLLRQEVLKDVFIRYVFKKRKMDHIDIEDSSSDGVDSGKMPEPMKIIHKEQDIITAFAMNQANASCLTLATQKEIVELDISNVLNPPIWLDDENEMDIEHLRNPTPANPAENVDFLVVQTPVDATNYGGSGTVTPITNQSSTSSTPTTYLAPGQLTQTGRGTSMVKGVHIPGVTNPLHSFYVIDRSRRMIRTITRRVIGGVRRIGSHPQLPHYLTGSADGSVRLWEWGHSQPLTVLRTPGTFPKVTKVLFSAQGNKCCVSDSEGHICLWQVGLGSNFSKPIMSLPCHNKTTSDFVFVGSSSLIATAGHSSESRNVCLWDTLLPQRSACVHAFTCHEHGSPAVVYAPHHQLLISGGRRGEICIFDIRQRQMRHTFQAHESPIRCLAMDPEEEFFVTGSAEGDIKVWGLDIHQLISCFPGEHSKSSTFFRNMGASTGVTQVDVGPGHHLFSCGVDGSVKFRALPERDSIVRFWTA